MSTSPNPAPVVGLKARKGVALSFQLPPVAVPTPLTVASERTKKNLWRRAPQRLLSPTEFMFVYGDDDDDSENPF
jgi:hypothetical protein